MGRFRSDWGAQAYAALMTVLNTAKRKGQSTSQTLVHFMGKPALPFLHKPVLASVEAPYYKTVADLKKVKPH